MSNDFKLWIKLDNGNIYDSSLDGASLVDAIDVAANELSGRREYPELAGFSGYAQVLNTSASAFGTVLPVFSYQNGYPVLSFTRRYPVRGVYTNTATILVFAR